jgi:Tol biopolymer transport system component
LGQWLTDIPDPYKNSDCCWIGPRVAVSPNGQKLALVVDKIKGTKSDRFTFSIYVFDIPTGSLSVLSDGEFPKWSPDGKRIAFRRGNTENDRGLWIADVETGKVWLLIKDNAVSKDVFISNWVWSPDSRQIVYQFNQGYQSVPGIWMIDLDNKSPLLMPETDKLVDRFPMGVHVDDWLPDGQHLLVMAEDPAKGLEHVSSFWILSIKSGELVELTHDMRVGGGLLSPDGKWLAINASRHYEGERQPADIWLLNLDDKRLLRVTFAPPEDIGGYWSPDGTRLVFRREGVGLAMLSLQTGNVSSLGVDLLDTTSYNYTVGGSK